MVLVPMIASGAPLPVPGPAPAEVKILSNYIIIMTQIFVISAMTMYL